MSDGDGRLVESVMARVFSAFSGDLESDKFCPQQQGDWIEALFCPYRCYGIPRLNVSNLLGEERDVVGRVL